ncbi:hypothetical protein D3C75_813500 [compost metagenome]
MPRRFEEWGWLYILPLLMINDIENKELSHRGTALYFTQYGLALQLSVSADRCEQLVGNIVCSRCEIITVKV